MQNENFAASDLENLRDELKAFQERLVRVESALEQMHQNSAIQPRKESLKTDEAFEINLPFQAKKSIEFSVGEYGMAWIGNIVLFFGITFLISYLQNTGSQVFSVFVGFLTVAILYAGAYFTQKSYLYLSRLFAFNGHLLLYFFTLKLHFFQADPILKNPITSLVLLISVSLVLLIVSWKRESQQLAALVFLMFLITGIVSNSSLLISGLAAFIALLATLLYYRFAWLKLAFFFVFIVYLIHLNWLLNNPLMGNTLELIAIPGLNYIGFILSGFIFSMLAIIPKKENVSNEFVVSSVIWNGLGFSILLAIIIITYFQKNYVPIFASITLFCLLFSVILKLRSALKITASIYVLYGFLAMSVAIYGIFGLPKSYPLFVMQSLLVVSMALWFRSRFIVIMNLILFLFIVGLYTRESSISDITNFSILLVAIISARIINWKKERLQIKTELVRDVYLVAGLFMTLFAFYHLSTPSYITASWIFSGVLLFLLGVLLKNKKYRWMAIVVMLISAIRLIFVDMSSIDIGYRVLVFLILAIISIAVSVLYTKYFNRQ